MVFWYCEWGSFLFLLFFELEYGDDVLAFDLVEDGCEFVVEGAPG